MIHIVIITYIILTSPAWLEAFVIDPYIYWRRLKNDKPGSTYIRGLLMVVVPIVVDWGMGYGHWYYGLMIAFFFHVLFFAPLVNLQLKRKIDYLGSGKYDTYIKRIPLWVRLVVSVILLAGAVILFEIFKY